MFSNSKVNAITTGAGVRARWPENAPLTDTVSSAAYRRSDIRVNVNFTSGNDAGLPDYRPVYNVDI